MSIRNAFKMPSPMNISGRSSSITNAFVCAIIPRIEPTESEIKTALKILHMDPDSMSCAYCGAEVTEWDHLRPLVAKQQPTGYISEIRNLVPSCGKCNQSKGNKYWKDWITSTARFSPKTKNINNLQQKIDRLEEYEKWGNVQPINLEAIVPPDIWKQHWDNWKDMRKIMTKAQNDAQRLNEILKVNIDNRIKH
jgi:5-methylcytosine-specific restriction endonuclease McrA